MKLNFTKMHGLGNDFVVLDGITQSINLNRAQWRWLGDRHFGVGADQLLLVERATVPGADFRYRIFNSDGGEVEHCGNGARCFVRFVTDQGLTDKRSIVVDTMNGRLTLTLQDDGDVTVDMGAPIFETAKVPFLSTGLAVTSMSHTWQLPFDGQMRSITAVSMGNPHAVQVVDDVNTAPVTTEGPKIVAHSAFPAQVNAGFMQIMDRHTIALRVFERGAGETLACGTGACAAVVAGMVRGLLDSPVRVETRGGALSIAWAGDARDVTQGATHSVLMTGPATRVFDGTVSVPDVLDLA